MHESRTKLGMINEKLRGETINTDEILFTEEEATKNEIVKTYKANNRPYRSSRHINQSDPTLYEKQNLGKSMTEREIFKEFDDIQGLHERLSNAQSNKRNLTIDLEKLGESRM